jgi:Domain of unknown function (DUF1992)
MDRWESLIERRIREAHERGEFDDLPGQGQPLHFEENPFEDPELSMAHHILKNAGMAPAWIEERREIQQTLETARSKLARSGDREAFAAELDRLNARIRSYNLRAPSTAWHLHILSLD